MHVLDSDLTALARIRNAALEGFAKNGVAATSIRDVAKAAGVSAGLVQHHFSTKAALTEAVNDYVVAVALAAFEDVPAATSTADASQELGRRITTLIAEHPEALRYVARAGSEADPGALNIFDSFVSIAEKQWQQLAADGLLRADTDQQWAALNTVIFNLAPLLFQTAIERHLPRTFLDPQELERWQNASTKLFREGIYQGQVVKRVGAEPPCPASGV